MSTLLLFIWKPAGHPYKIGISLYFLIDISFDTYPSLY